MTQKLEAKVKTLKETLDDFIRHTERSLTRLSNVSIDLHHKIDDYRETSAREMQEFKEEMRTSRETSAREMQEFKREMAKKWGDLANRLGTFAEDIVAPNVVPMAQKYFNCPGKPLDFVIRRIKTHSKDRGREQEYDAYAVYDEAVVLSEAKATPRQEYLDNFVRIISEFFDFFPEHTGKKLIPVFASLYIPDNIVKYATRNRIYVMALKGDTMDLLNYHEIDNLKTKGNK